MLLSQHDNLQSLVCSETKEIELVILEEVGHTDVNPTKEGETRHSKMVPLPRIVLKQIRSKQKMDLDPLSIKR